MATDPASGHVCTEIIGLSDVALTFDGGKTLVQSRRPRSGVKLVYVVSLGAPYTLAALVTPLDGPNPELFISTDGGCHWTSRGHKEALHVAAGHDGIAYAWAHELLAVSAGAVRQLGPPPGTIDDLAVDVADSRHIRFAGPDGVFDSTDGAASWRKVGDIASPSNTPAFAFAPADLNHVLYSRERFPEAVQMEPPPIQLSRDGGRSWARSTGNGRAGELFLSADGSTAWSFGPTFYRSVDGGASFAKVATPIPSLAGDVAWVGAQDDPNVLVLAGYETPIKGTWSTFLLRFDLHSFEWKRQLLPLDAGRFNDGYTTTSESVRGATFVPGETSAICLGITRSPGIEPLR
jgi:hypothetical protein